MKKLLFLLALPLSIAGWSQNLTISARVVDEETRESLGYASVGIKGAAIGTISNDQGEFDFHFSPEHKNDILVVSMLGYKNFEAPIWSFQNDQTHTIELKKSPIVLQEVVVSDTLTGGDILRIALSRIEKNYPMQPFLIEGFYRDVKKVGGTYISLMEAAVKIYDENYTEPRNKLKLRERVKLVEVRQSIGYESKFTKYFDQDNLLEDLLLHNPIRYRQFVAEDEFFDVIQRDKNSFYDNHDIYVVSHSGDYDLKIFIDTENFSVIHLEFGFSNGQDEIGKKKNLVGKFTAMKKIVDFRSYGGKMYLSYMAVTSNEHWFDAETKELKFETELFQQLLINKINPLPTERIGSTEKMRNYGLQYQDQPYNKVFWDNYNLIKETPLDKKILADLEKLAPLEQQFSEY